MDIQRLKSFDMKRIAQLYAQVGWDYYVNNLPMLQKRLENSLLVLGAYEGK